jgi:hypothetical protein
LLPNRVSAAVASMVNPPQKIRCQQPRLWLPDWGTKNSKTWCFPSRNSLPDRGPKEKKERKKLWNNKRPFVFIVDFCCHTKAPRITIFGKRTNAAYLVVSVLEFVARPGHKKIKKTRNFQTRTSMPDWGTKNHKRPGKFNP